MKKIIIISSLTFLIISIMYAQPLVKIDSKNIKNISNLKYKINLQNDRFIESISSQKYSEGGKPTEDIYQYWSIDNNRWENGYRITYEYAVGKTKAIPFPNLIRTYEWFWCKINLIWDLKAWTNTTWNVDGTPESQITYDANATPLWKTEYTGPIYGSYPTRTDHFSYAGGWGLNIRYIRTFNPDGSLQRTEIYDCTSGICEQDGLWEYMYGGHPGYPDVVTYSECNGECHEVYEERTTYDQNCVGNEVPYNQDIPPGPPKEVNCFTSTTNGAAWFLLGLFHWGMGDHCTAEEYESSNAQGDNVNRATFDYINLGSGKIRAGSVLDNSDVRLVLSESEIWDGTQWVKSTRNWYSYEGIQMSSDKEITTPGEFSLDQNYPNPFNPSTTITFDLSEDTNVKISIYDMTGRLIRELVNQQMTIGSKMISWDGKDDTGNPVSGGVYLYNLQTGDYNQTKKMVLMK